MITAGVISGLVAAPFGLVDWLGIPTGTRARKIGAVHGLGNVVVVVAFAGSWLLRIPDPLSPTGAAMALSIGGFLLPLVTGWLGGELVGRLGVGVDEGGERERAKFAHDTRGDDGTGHALLSGGARARPGGRQTPAARRYASPDATRHASRCRPFRPCVDSPSMGEL
jgi:hypothetical protein